MPRVRPCFWANPGVTDVRTRHSLDFPHAQRTTTLSPLRPIPTINNCVDTNRNQNFRYDNLNRIRYAWSDGPIWGEQYTIDPWGNLTNIASYNGKPNFETQNQPVFANNQITGVGFDAVGNQTSTTDLWGLPHNYTYDPESRISTVDNAFYAYNGDGQRVVKNIGGTGTIYWYGADGSVLGESDLSGNLTAEYVFFDGHRFARTDNPASTTGTSSLKYYLTDHLGSTTMLADATFSTVLEDTDYYPYGGEIFPDPTNSNHYKFTGKERDAETGNDYFGARYYGSAVGRFMTIDSGPFIWTDPQTLNRYTYTRNNPLKFVDPTGKYFVVSSHDQKFFQNALSHLYQRPGGRELVKYLAGSNKPILLDRANLKTSETGTVGVSVPLGVSGIKGVVAIHTTVGTDSNLMTGMKSEPKKVGSETTTAHELEHDKAGLDAGQNSLQAGSQAMDAGDAPSKPGAKDTTGGTAQAGADEIMGEKTDVKSEDAQKSVQEILKSGQEQWQNDPNRNKICSENQSVSENKDICH